MQNLDALAPPVMEVATVEGLQPVIASVLAEHGIPEDVLDMVNTFYLPLAEKIALWRRKKGKDTLILGINGAQGSGKTTLAALLAVILPRAFGLNTVAFSIDDLYLTRIERQEVAKDVHPLFLTRGVPGTHDVALGHDLLDALAGATEQDSVQIPVFDKAHDDRAPKSEWRAITGPVDVIIIEGWCVGSTAQDDVALAKPLNDLERHDDAQGDWRGHVNSMLSGDYAGFFARIDRLIMLGVPSFEKSHDWRREQENKLRSKSPQGTEIMDDAQLARFMMHYERLTRHNLATLPGLADAYFQVGDDHKIKKAVYSTE